MGHDEHAEFVGTKVGCAQYEVFMAIAVFPVSILLRNIAVPWIFLGRNFKNTKSGYWLKFALDFVILIVPAILAQTVMANSLGFLILILCLCIVTLLCFVGGEFWMLGKHRPAVKTISNKIIEEHHHPTTFVTFFRSIMLFLTGIAILAVDFRVFPRKFAKTELLGHSLMDVGVAAFVYGAALAPQLKTASMREKGESRMSSRFWFFRSSTAILVYLGLIRTVSLTLLDYPQHVTEYGVHWNFFYTFAVIKIVTRLLPSRFYVLTATIFAILQQTMLSSGYQDWILDPASPRNNLFELNREGICSLMGYLSMYYFASAVGKFCAGTGYGGFNRIRIRSWMHCSFHLLIGAVIFLMLQKGTEMAFGGPCRRVVNLPYVFSMVSLLTFITALCVTVQTVTLIAWAARMPHFGTEDNPWESVQPCLMDTINRFGLPFFLLGNVMTGCVNMLIDAHSADDITAMICITVYMLVKCAFAGWYVTRQQQNVKGR